MKVSIILPTFKRNQFLQQSIESIFAQTYDNFEVVLCDDDPNSLLQFSDKRIRYFRNEQNVGQAVNVLNGISKATGDLVCIFHDDDIMSHDYLESFVQVFKTTNASVVYADHFWTNEFGVVDSIMTDNNSKFYKRSQLPEGFVLDSFKECVLAQSVPLISVMWRRDLIKISEVAFQTGAAIDLWIRFLLSASKDIYYIPNRYNFYRQHEVSQTSAGNQRDMAKRLMYVYAHILFSEQVRGHRLAVFKKMISVLKHLLYKKRIF